MNSSIFIVGSDEFHATLLNRLQCLAACHLESISSQVEALPLIQAKHPDMIILQLDQADSLQLCHQIKQQSNLAWIYCILISDQPTDAIAEILPGWNWELALRAAALEAQADAYFWLSEPKNSDLYQDASWKLQNRLLSSQIKAGIRQVQIYRDLLSTNDILSAIALADPLTELSNRRALDWELPRQVQNARSGATPLSLLILDIDFFKSINDNYGHLVGDRVLQLLCARLRHNLRFQDTPFRYGGEEFVILLSNTSPQEAESVAQRINSLIANQHFMIDKNLAVTITVSIGVASLQPDDDDQGISLLDRADHNLLRAKSGGRNRVITGKEES